MAEWIEVTTEAELEARGRLCAEAGGRPLLLLRVEAQIHAIEDRCPHAGLPLADGECRGRVLTCPFHGYAFDIRTGRNIDSEDEPPLPRFPVRVNAGRVEVYA